MKAGLWDFFNLFECVGIYIYGKESQGFCVTF